MQQFVSCHGVPKKALLQTLQGGPNK